MKYANGDVYVGSWKNGDRHGYGEMRYKDGASYIGDWYKDYMHGNGEYIWQSGKKYVGEWKNSKMEGQGTYYLKDGDVYQGQFYDDKFNGKGNYFYSNGDVFEGYWKDDNRHGEGTYFYADGDYYEGYWKNDKRDGQGTYYHKDGSKDIYQYSDGYLEDSYEVVDANKIRQKGVEAYNQGYFQTAMDYFYEAKEKTESYSLKEQLEQDIADCKYNIRKRDAYEAYNEGLRLYNMGSEYLAIEYFKKAKDLFGSEDYWLSKECDELIYECL